MTRDRKTENVIAQIAVLSTDVRQASWPDVFVRMRISYASVCVSDFTHVLIFVHG